MVELLSEVKVSPDEALPYFECDEGLHLRGQTQVRAGHPGKGLRRDRARVNMPQQVLRI